MCDTHGCRSQWADLHRFQTSHDGEISAAIIVPRTLSGMIQSARERVGGRLQRENLAASPASLGYDGPGRIAS